MSDSYTASAAAGATSDDATLATEPGDSGDIRFNRRAYLSTRAVWAIAFLAITFFFAAPIDQWLQGQAIPALIRVLAIYVLLLLVANSCLLPWILAAQTNRRRQKKDGEASSSQSPTLLRLVATVYGFAMAYYAVVYLVIWTCGAWWWLIMIGPAFFIMFSHHCLLPNLESKKSDLVDSAKTPELYDRLRGLAEAARISLHGIYRVQADQKQEIGVCLIPSGKGRDLLLGNRVLEELTPAELDAAFEYELCRDSRHHSAKLLAWIMLLMLVEYAAVAIAAYAWTEWEYSPTAYSQLPAASVAALVSTFLILDTFSDPLKHALARRLERQSHQMALRQAGSELTVVSTFTKLANAYTYDPYLFSTWRPDPRDRLTISERIAEARTALDQETLFRHSG